MKIGTRHEYYVNDRGDLAVREIQPVETIHELSLRSITKAKNQKQKKHRISNDESGMMNDQKTGNGESSERKSGISD